MSEMLESFAKGVIDGLCFSFPFYRAGRTVMCTLDLKFGRSIRFLLPTFIHRT